MNAKLIMHYEEYKPAQSKKMEPPPPPIFQHGYLGDVWITFNEACYMDINLPPNQHIRIS